MTKLASSDRACVRQFDAILVCGVVVHVYYVQVTCTRVKHHFGSFTIRRVDFKEMVEMENFRIDGILFEKL